jgi:two-component system CheB/CheR fusion protein
MSQVETKIESRKPEYFVGIGASAGGLEALQAFVSNLPAEQADTCFVIAQHLSPTYRSQLVELIARQTPLPVLEVQNHTEPVAGTIYVTPPDSEITIKDGRLHLEKPRSGHGPRPSVDVFFDSMARELASGCAAIILSGTGSDGSDGIRKVKESGGVTIVQDPSTAKYDGMPQAALESGSVDFVLPASEIGEKLGDILRGLIVPEGRAFIPDLAKSALDTVMQKLSQRTGTDFTKYKPATLGRRLDRRITALGLQDAEEYLETLEGRPGELEALFNTVLIGVTYFFRDLEAFERIRECLREILKGSPETKIRFWVPGCATGEEAYSLALLVAEHLGPRLPDFDVQIFATDIDDQAITTARKGLYPASALENVSEEMLRKYFQRRGDHYEVSKSIRSLILFSRHDVTTNPPFLKLDLISCRNLLIYFNQELQNHVLPIFHYALKPDAFLFLGKSETVGVYSDLFKVVDQKYKVYQRKRGASPYAVRIPSFRAGLALSRPSAPGVERGQSLQDLVKETIYNTFESPYVVIDSDMRIQEVGGDVNPYIQIRPGTMDANLLKLAVSPLEIELRTIVTQAMRESQIVYGKMHRWEPEAGRYLRLIVKPLLFTAQFEGLYIIIFESIELDEAAIRIVDAATVPSSEASETRVAELEHELSATRQHLQNYIEELETSSEELQSLNEELQSTNEELQSSNEELETSNEELQSTNEELNIAYNELKAVTNELENQQKNLQKSRTNIRALLNNTMQGFLLIDRSYQVLSLNHVAAELIKRISGQDVQEGNLVIDVLPSHDLESFYNDFKRSLSGESVSVERSVPVGNARGEKLWIRYQFTPVYEPVEEDKSLSSADIGFVSLGIMDISATKQLEYDLSRQKGLVESILNTAQVGISLTDREGHHVQVNPGYCRLLGYSESELIGLPFTAVMPSGIEDYALRMHRRFIDGAQDDLEGEWKLLHKDGHTIQVQMTAGRLVTDDGEIYRVSTVVDITHRRRAEEERERLFNVSRDMMCTIRYDGFLQDINPAWEGNLGLSREELLSRPFIEFVHPEDREHTMLAFEEAVADPAQKIPFENRYQTSDGGYRWLSWNYAQIPDRRLFYATARDITESKKARDLLRDTQMVARVGGWEVDLGSGRTTWTEEVYRIHELPEDTDLGELDTMSFYEPADRTRIKDAMDRAVEYGESSDLELAFTTARHRSLWVRLTVKAVQERNHTIKILGTFQDITARKKTELQIRRLSMVAQQTDNGVIILGAHREVEWANEGLGRILGVDVEKHTGGGIAQLLAAEAELDAGVQAELDARLDEGDSFSFEFNFEGKSSNVWLRLDVTPLSTERGDLQGHIILIFDLTEKKETEKQLMAARDRAEESSRLKSNFLANMSHEIRTPLNGIMGLSRLIGDEATDEGIREYATMISQSGDRLLRTINQVLDLSRIEANRADIHLVRINLNEQVGSVVGSLGVLAREKGLILETRLEEGQLYSSLDPDMVQDILHNLLGNAIKFTSEGKVTISTGRCLEIPENTGTEILHRDSNKGESKGAPNGGPYVFLTVADTGIGIDPEYQSRMFQPFSQESSGQGRTYQGSGLGLSIALRFTHLQGGRLFFQSKKGQGSQFTVYFRES